MALGSDVVPWWVLACECRPIHKPNTGYCGHPACVGCPVHGSFIYGSWLPWEQL